MEIDSLVKDAKNRSLKFGRQTIKTKIKELRAAGDKAQEEWCGEQDVEALVDRFSAEHFVFTSSDTVSICSWTKRAGRRQLVQRSVADFELVYANEAKACSLLTGNKVAAAQVWEEHRRKREVKEFVFEPDPEKARNLAGRGQENLFEGFAVAAKPSDIEPFRQHLYDVLAAEKPELQRTEIVEYLLDSLAHFVQRPGTPLKVALVLRGKQGATGRRQILCNRCHHLALQGQYFRDEPGRRYCRKIYRTPA